ncbi:hypothetical protein PLEOSDRAFT_1107273 [Pleurotus ostreatus PC15]|uniref:Ubiquinone biosynthesis protein n=2 Tax=Pleurotus TaxID=5320 RepID=A0A067NL83_PLEO1|nr:hypothetical protein CCMSSC00406_0002296 [Pleurotus cornucopiae]KDQ24346.1 hypothetical protein PLEOSDRAFT_1107273 [Pleurotus ostreatus PC15]
MLSSVRLLKLALPLIPTHGFTRAALAESVLALPASSQHTAPLSDTAVSALFGEGDDARRTLINAWLAEGISQMGKTPSSAPPLGQASPRPSIRDILHQRLRYNEQALQYLPEAFACLATPTSITSMMLTPLDPVPAVKHAVGIADEACCVSGDQSLQLSWYARRAALAGIYTAAELHQLASPKTAHAFLDSLLASSSKLHASVEEVGLFGGYVMKSWQGIIRSSGIF